MYQEIVITQLTKKERAKLKKLTSEYGSIKEFRYETMLSRQTAYNVLNTDNDLSPDTLNAIRRYLSSK